MKKINAPYKKLKEIIINKYKGRMEFRDFDKQWFIELNGKKTVIASEGSCFFKEIDSLYKPKYNVFPSHSDMFTNDLIDNAEEEILKRFGGS